MIVDIVLLIVFFLEFLDFFCLVLVFSNGSFTLFRLRFFLKIPNRELDKLINHQPFDFFDERVDNFNSVINFFETAQKFKELNNLFVKRPLIVILSLFLGQLSPENGQELRFEEDFMQSYQNLDNKQKDLRLSISEPDSIFNFQLIC